ncbi:MAG TPA: hypothetical protein VKT49_01690, partial [Bryobacteraceae bacterium]|nr:hypothetical protein [Bryobacteraceae bacterium]
MRFWLLLLAGCLSSLAGQDAREIVRRSVELDQMNWLRMADYTWTARSLEKHLDSQNRVTSEHEEGWETIVLGGEPYRHDLERDGKPLPSGQQKREQEKLDRLAARLEKETPEQKQHRLAEYANKRRREREFLLEIPEAFDLRREPDEEIDGQDVWVISGVPNPAYHAKSRDARALAKIRGKLWIEKS